jgi:UDP-N-acetylmuramoyl-tripeptide--D-alanyl-D-alanine ligase
MLKKMAQRRLSKFKGRVIAVTGSVGKTSTKEAIYTVLNSRFRVRCSSKSMNSDFGVLLTILDIESGYSSATKWTWYLMKGFLHSLRRDHSEVLLLEVGVDTPGDMDFIASIIRPDMVVLTEIAEVHVGEGQFANVEEVLAEKVKIVEAMGEDGVLVVNTDNERLAAVAKKRGKKGTVAYGRSKEADFWASNVQDSLEGLRFILHSGEERFEVKVPVLGDYQIYSLLPAIVAGVKLGMSFEQAVVAIQRYRLPPGRMSLIEGINESLILDSSYNASPKSVAAALKVLKDYGADRRKVAVLGNMNELGERSEELHKIVGEAVPMCADLLLTVGSQAKLIAEKATEKGFLEKNVLSFSNAGEAAETFKDQIKKGDLILVKGSQNKVRLERFVKEIMLHPDLAKDQLVRQEKVWEAKL